MRTLIFVIIILLMMAGQARADLVGQPSLDFRDYEIDNSSSRKQMPQQMMQNIMGSCQQGGQPNCRNRWTGRTPAALVPLGYDPVTGYMIMRPAYGATN